MGTRSHQLSAWAQNVLATLRGVPVSARAEAWRALQRVAEIIHSEWWPDASDGALAQMGVEVEARTEEDEVAPHAASEDILQMGLPERPEKIAKTKKVKAPPPRATPGDHAEWF